MISQVVHVIPESVFANQWHGSYKDTISRIQFLQKNAPSYTQIIVGNDDPSTVRAQYHGDSSASFLIEYTTLPNIVRSLRRRHPDAFIAIRSHNLEALQHFDNHGLIANPLGLARLAYGMGRLLTNDLIVKHFGSAIWSISEWENRVYWQHLPGKASISWMPYCCPDFLMPNGASPTKDRRMIACVPTSQKNRKSWHLVTQFIEFAEAFGKEIGAKYEFVVTGDLDGWRLPRSSHITFTGMVSDLRSFLSGVRAVALLSDLGYGFKTTIGDAIAHDAVVLASSVLYRRCPRLLQPAIFPIASKNPDWRLLHDSLESTINGYELNLQCASQQSNLMERLCRGPERPRT